MINSEKQIRNSDNQLANDFLIRGNGKYRSDIKPGLCVDIIQKQDQRTGKTTRGVVREILTGSSTHPHGIKVRLTSGHVGRICSIIDPIKNE